MKLKIVAMAGMLLVGMAVQVQAAFLTFVPPNDQTGQVFTTNRNDGWSLGRGLVFSATQNVLIDSVGLYHDLSGNTLNFQIAQVNSTSGLVTSGQTILRSGSSSVTTNGLEWIDFSVAPLLLTVGNNYHINFSFQGNGNQNFFYNNGNVAWAQDGLALLDGTTGGDTSNFVVAAFRVNAVQEVPEPASIAMWGLGAIGLTCVRRRLRAVAPAGC